MLKLKITFTFFLFFLLLLVAFLIKLIDTSYFDHKLSAYTAWHIPTTQNIGNYLEKITDPDFKSYLRKVTSLQMGLNSKSSLSEVYQSVVDLQKNTGTNLYAFDLQKREAKIPIDFELESKIDENLVEGFEYISPGIIGNHVYLYDLLLFSSKDFFSSKYANITYHKVEPVAEILFTGSKSVKDSEKVISKVYNQFIEDLKEGENQFEIDNPEKLEGLSIKKITFTDEQGILKNSEVSVGSMTIELGNCFKDFSLNIVYNPLQKGYAFDNLQEFVEGLCKKQYIKADGYLIGTCEDCNYYPVDKTHALRPDYAPKFTFVTFAAGGQRIATDAYNDFYEMYTAARDAGFTMKITSGYRSYTDQVYTFEAWVQYEMSQGHSRAQAEANANSYSARPGFSEHQLGTTLDITTGSCGLSTGCNGNQGLWSWMNKNAYKYGFALSYAAGKESQTGYIHEPWHWRWLGKAMAKEFKEVESSTWLAEFLREKGLF